MIDKTSLFLFLGAGILIAGGAYLKSHPEWSLRTDIQDYNLGVSAYFEPPTPEVKPVEKAAPYFEKAASESEDKRVKSLALYNLGTMIGKEAFEARGLTTTFRAGEIVTAVRDLAGAVRNDPHNEEAKFNLELLERMLGSEVRKEAGPGPGYSPGEVDIDF